MSDPTWCHETTELRTPSEPDAAATITCGLPSHHFGGRRHERRLVDPANGRTIFVDWPIDRTKPAQTTTASNPGVRAAAPMSDSTLRMLMRRWCDYNAEHGAPPASGDDVIEDIRVEIIRELQRRAPGARSDATSVESDARTERP